ncbi:hypothetical protein HPB51_005752 [Rhipicephalus microplus]|uniref:CWH43-like N-terminal domain-containing protein n=1 Tax=Rhipicephalus microplus TaxID=6941 RepID=A0A9J6DTJ9_RHIMP|nr:hypothetical protein HPB51_005752 [Rhipicephalus microplus]
MDMVAGVRGRGTTQRELLSAAGYGVGDHRSYTTSMSNCSCALTTFKFHTCGYFQGSHSSRISRKYVKVGVIVYFVIVPVVSSIAISHLWAVGNADVPFFLPYISDSGGDPPQSAVFGLGLTTAAIAAIVTFSLRYVTVMDISRAKNLPGYILLLNYINFLAGIGIFLGLILVAMNPTGHLRRDGTWLSPIFVPHVIGASVLFVSGLGYMLANALLTLCLVDQYRNYAMFKARVVIFAFDLVACALSILLTVLWCRVAFH